MPLISHMGIDYDSPNIQIQDNASATDLDNTKVPTGQTVKAYINKNITTKEYSVTTTSNSYVSPFGAYAELNMSTDISTYGRIIGMYPFTGATNPCSCEYNATSNLVHVWSKSATSNGKLIVTFCKLGTVV